MNKQAFSTLQPKTSYYKTDGTGRDLYIAYDSGGHFHPDKKLGSRPNTAGYRIRPLTPCTIGSKSVHYHSDGSGRDYYIKVSDGGLHSFPYRGQTVFTNSLRSYEKMSTNRSATDLLSWSQGWMPARSRSLKRFSRIKAQGCVSRLSQPKRREWI